MISQFRYFAVMFLWLFLFACGKEEISPALNYKVPEMPGPIAVIGRSVEVSPILLREYISNPGIGWQHRPERSDISNFPETILYSNRRSIGWKMLNPADGFYDWGPLDSQLQSAVENGKQFSFRVYTMVGEGYYGHMVPDWVIEKGAVILESGEPDYSSCIYQDEWARFIDEMVQRYDGNPEVAFIDISGYGNFNEWSWSDHQTEWDQVWEDNYPLGTALPSDFQTLDGQARRRLADMFIGGANGAHQCREADGAIVTLPYVYQGFQKTQLVMPYAGIAQSTQYVYSRRVDVGFRYDCLGWNGDRLLEKVGNELLSIWKTAPVVFELCKPDDVSLDQIQYLTSISHASVVHDNVWEFSYEELDDLMRTVGYRYFLKKAVVDVADGAINLEFTWQNVGLSPSYPKMGQNFQLYVHILSKYGEPVLTAPLDADISSWMPAINGDQAPIEYVISHSLAIPSHISAGEYLVGVSILDLRRQIPINLAFGGRDEQDINILSWIKIR